MTAVTLFMACTFLNIMAGDMVRNTIEEEFTATYDKFYACKEHDIAGTKCFKIIYLKKRVLIQYSKSGESIKITDMLFKVISKLLYVLVPSYLTEMIYRSRKNFTQEKNIFEII